MIRLRELRKQKGLTMKQLGDLVGLAESTISLYETGKRQPDQDTMVFFADFFGISIDYLLGREEETEQHDLQNVLLLGNNLKFARRQIFIYQLPLYYSLANKSRC